MPKNLIKFLKPQIKYIVIYLLVIIIFNFVVVYGLYIFSNFFDNLANILDKGNYEKFLSSLIWVGIIEVLILFFGVLDNVTYTKFRGYMNIYIRVYGVNNIIDMDYNSLAKFGSGKLLQIIHNGLGAYSFFISKSLVKTMHFQCKTLVSKKIKLGYTVGKIYKK